MSTPSRFSPPHPLAQTTLNVGPGQPYTTIQSGIDAASNGDTVLVAPSTYYENVDFKGKAITVTSSGGAAVTTIDGGGAGSTVTMTTNEPRTAVLSRFTITHGGPANPSSLGSAGAGIYIANSAPTILNNVVTQNYCQNIQAEFAAPLIQGNEVSSSLNAAQCVVTFTGGINIGGTYRSTTGVPLSPLVIGNTIENNTTGQVGDGGGDGGAGVWDDAASNLVIESNIIRNNTTHTGNGGGILVFNSSPVAIVNNLIYGNSAGCGGGGIAFEALLDRSPYSFLIANNTIADNTSTGQGGYSNCSPIAQIYPGFAGYGASSPTTAIINNIISGSTSYPAINCAWYQTPSESIQPTFQNNVLYNAGGPFFGSYCVDVSGKYNNIAADPQFVSPSTGDYHLSGSSPAIDAGQNAVLQTMLSMVGTIFTNDLDGNPRIQNGTNRGCIIDIGAYEYRGFQSCSTNVTLFGSPNPSNYGQSVTFTAQLSSSFGVPTGDVQFSDGTTVLGTEAISSTGVSTFSTSTLSVGTHTITAIYQPTGIYAPLSVSLKQVVNGDSTTTALSCSTTSLSVSQTAQLAAVVTSTNGTPTGSITFTDNGTALDTQTLVSGAANLTYTASAVGQHTLTATFNPTGAYSSSSASCSETVTALPSTSVLAVKPATASFGSPVTLTATVSPGNSLGTSAPTGTVTFLSGSSSIGTAALANGVATLTLNTLPGGNDNLTCTYSGSTVYAPSSCNIVPILVNAAPTTTALTAAPNPTYATNPVTITATVDAPGLSAQPTSGTVTFYDGSTSIATQPLSASATATLTISTLAVGTHPVTATFNPANNTFVTSTSPVVNVQMLASGFTIEVAPNAITLKTGATGTVAVQLASVGNFAGPLSLTYGQLPADATASINPATVTLTAGGTGSSSLTINTLLKASNRIPTRPGSRELPIAFATLLLLLIPSRRRMVPRLLGIAVLAFTLQTITGCTNSWYTASVVAPGTYQVPVNATDVNHNSQTATLTVTVTPNP